VALLTGVSANPGLRRVALPTPHTFVLLSTYSLAGRLHRDPADVNRKTSFIPTTWLLCPYSLFQNGFVFLSFPIGTRGCDAGGQNHYCDRTGAGERRLFICLERLATAFHTAWRFGRLFFVSANSANILATRRLTPTPSGNYNFFK